MSQGASNAPIADTHNAEPGIWDSLQCCLPALFCRPNLEQKRGALVQKNGSYRVFSHGLSKHRSKFLADMYITVLDMEWRYIMVILFSVFIITFVFFSFCWWLMAFVNGDFENVGNPDHDFCLEGVDNFAGALLFSMETQTTIGWGISYPNAHCGATIPLMYLQVVVGLFLETFMLGAIFVKIARPKYRANTILFSKQAVVNQEDGKMVLQIRVGDVRKSYLVASSVSAMVIHHYTSNEGAFYPIYQFSCNFTANGMLDRVCLLWPVILTHVIDKDSPLYDIQPSKLISEHFEIIVFLSGTVESTGEMCQARTSYLFSEILWGHKFEGMEEFDTDVERWYINFSAFNETQHYQTINYSAKELDRLQATKLKKSTSAVEGGTSLTLEHEDQNPRM